jgi:HPt (histidine-containing phosphotransfer) domain-containing protein
MPIGNDEELDNLSIALGIDKFLMILETAISSHKDQFIQLQECVEKEDLRTIHTVAHTLKGSASLIFGIRLAALAGEIQSNSDDLEFVKALLPAIEKTLEETLNWWESKTDVSPGKTLSM